MDVYKPTEGGPWPVVVMWHGQPASLDASNSARLGMGPLAAAVAEQGAVVFNASYGAATPSEFVNDIGCSLQLAAESAPDCTADADSVQVLPDAVVATSSGTNPLNLQVEAWQQADDAVLDAGTPILLVGGNPDLQAFFATQEGPAGVFALPSSRDSLTSSSPQSTRCVDDAVAASLRPRTQSLGSAR